MKHPRDIIGAEAVRALRDTGWIVVREDAIRLAQSHAAAEERQRLTVVMAEAA